MGLDYKTLYEMAKANAEHWAESFQEMNAENKQLHLQVGSFIDGIRDAFTALNLIRPEERGYTMCVNVAGILTRTLKNAGVLEKRVEECRDQYGAAFCSKPMGHDGTHEGTEPVKVVSYEWASEKKLGE